MCRRRARIRVGVERERGQKDTSEVQEATKVWDDRKGKWEKVEAKRNNKYHCEI